MGARHWGYNPIAQFLANRGYAVLMPNFRGSTGYGKKFLNAGNGEWGRKMQDDITWGVKYLVAEGIADPKRLGIHGRLLRRLRDAGRRRLHAGPYAAAVDIVGPSNLITLLEVIPPYWEAGRKIMYARMADPGTPEGKAWLQERSPLNQATKHQDSAAGGAGRQRSSRESPRSRADRHRAARPRISGRVHSGPR